MKALLQAWLMLSNLHMCSVTQSIPIHTWAGARIGCQLDVHSFSLWCLASLFHKQTVHTIPAGSFLYHRVYLCVCVRACVYPVCSSSCVSNSSLSCRLMTELRERDSNMDRCLTPFSPDLEKNGQTLRAHTHTQKHKCTHTKSLSQFSHYFRGLSLCLEKGQGGARVIQGRGTASFTLYINPSSFPMATGPHTQHWDPRSPILPPHTCTRICTQRHKAKHAQCSLAGQVVTVVECVLGVVSF